MRIIKEIKQAPPIHQIFRQFYNTQDAVFLDSSLENDLGRYSIIALHPYLKLVQGERFTANGVEQTETFEDYLGRYLRENRDENETSLPMVSGAIGYFSYDYGRKRMGVPSTHQVKEETPHSGHNENAEIPDAILIFYDDFIIRDHREKRLFAVANGKLRPAGEAIRKLEEICQRSSSSADPNSESSHAPGSAPSVDLCTDTFSAPDGGSLLPHPGRSLDPAFDPSFSVKADFCQKEYMEAVEKMIHYIEEGDIYIANMTQQMQIQSPRHPWEVFETLRRDNPSPFGGYFQYGDFQIVCASPERFLQMRRGRIRTRPIKGTRPRGRDAGEDLVMRRELEHSEKDKSELLMIVDLERNDLNRVCLPGSVAVTELFTVEEYATVFHLVSEIEGVLSPEYTAADLIRAAHPGGSITGAPKRRAMEIIDELERSGRGLYTGSLGYLTLDGCCDFNIVIRTAIHCNGTYHLGVGGGITWESDPRFEHEETLQKAKAILRALSPGKGGEPNEAESYESEFHESPCR